MLVLTRKVGESINIGDDIVVNIIEIDKKKVRIGIKAPQKTPIYREEIYNKIQMENLKSSQQTSIELAKALSSILKKKDFEK